MSGKGFRWLTSGDSVHPGRTFPTKDIGDPFWIMEMLHIFLLFLAILLQSLAQEDLENKVFIFPESSNVSHVVLKPSPQRPLTGFTICLRSYTDMTRAHTLFSYATKTNDNEIVLFKSKPNEYSLYVGTSDVLFILPENLVSKPSLPCAGLDGKVFVFPTVSSDAYILLHPARKQQLQHFTLCLRFFTDLTRTFAFVSVASQQHDNEILLHKKPNEYELCVGGQCIAFHAPGNMDSTTNHWVNICTTWDSTMGIVQLWLDGQPLPRKGIAKGHRIPRDVVMMLGQDQDSYGGSLDAGQSFVGEMAEVYMWDTVLPPEQLRNIRRDTVPTPLVDWTALDFDIKGYVLTEPTLK